jgi:hypothetical protein
MNKTFTDALAEESERIDRALREIGYKTVNIRIENICVATDGNEPDLFIWVKKNGTLPPAKAVD